MTPLAHGRIVLWEGGSLWIFDVPALPPEMAKTDFHAHHAIQVTLALDGSFQLLSHAGVVAGPMAVVAPDARHAFEPRGLIALLFIEPESAAGRAARRALLAQASVAPSIRSCWVIFPRASVRPSGPPNPTKPTCGSLAGA